MKAQTLSQQTLFPIFLVGCPRSGTTLLQQILDAHPDIAVAPETHFVRRFWLEQAQYGDLLKDENYRAVIRAIAQTAEFSEMGLSAEHYELEAWRKPRNYATLLTLLLEQFRQKHGVCIVGEKTPNHLLYMQILQTLFPQAKFIHIIRDARAVVNSWRTVPWSTGNVTGDAKVWQRYMDTARRLPPAEGSMMTLHYENLVMTPKDCAQKICNFLSIEFDASMLNYHTKKSDRVNLEREPWKRNATKPLDAQSLTKWEKQLSVNEIARVEVVAKSELLQLGYTLRASRWQSVIAKAQIRIDAVINQTKHSIKTSVQQ
ncbi:MAG: sulfotransferase [Cyanobacteria bacterium J06560_5]